MAKACDRLCHRSTTALDRRLSALIAITGCHALRRAGGFGRLSAELA